MTTEQGRALLMLGSSGDAGRQVVSSQCRWRWATGVMLFPEAVCPLCRNAMTSNRIWVVDEANQRLAARYRLAGSSIVRDVEGRYSQLAGWIHPHVFPNHQGHGGSWRVCMGATYSPTIGAAVSVAHALFTGMYTRGAMGAFRGNIAQTTPAWKAWLAEVFDHSCATVRSRRVTVRGSRRRQATS